MSEVAGLKRGLPPCVVRLVGQERLPITCMTVGHARAPFMLGAAGT